MAEPRQRGSGLPPILAALFVARAAGQQDCTASATEPELNSRPWFCEPPNLRSGGNNDLARCLGEGHTLNRTEPGLCRGRWQWYQVSTVHDHNVPYYEVATLDDGPPVVLQHVRQTRVQANMRHALAFELETEYCPHTPECGQPLQPSAYYTTVDVLVVDGEMGHAWNSMNGGFGGLPPRQSIDTFYRGDRYNSAFRYYQDRRSVSFTLGFHMNHTRSCEPQLHDKVYIGVYCSWNPPSRDSEELENKQCRFSLTAHLIPEYVYDGFDATYPIAPAGVLGQDDMAPRYLRDELGVAVVHDAAAHYFRLPLGGFDVLNVSLERVGTNLTFYDVSGALGTNGHGLRGMLVRRRAAEGCPTASDHDQGINLTEITVTEELRSFCTDTADTAEYIFGVLADLNFGPLDPELPDSSQGKVGPEGVPLGYVSSALERTGYGAYRLRVHHIAYLGGEISHNETRGACLSYGQWRTYFIDTSGEADAAVEVTFTAPFSATYMRADIDVSRAPALAYDVASEPGNMVVSATPCDVTRPTRWHIAIRLGDETSASASQLVPAEFEMYVRLRSASVDVGGSVMPYEDGGRGFVCCGATRYFRLASIREAESVVANLNVTSGRVRAILTKWGSCPTETDVDALRGECTGFCAMEWLTTRGAYSGTYYNSPQARLVVPHGHGDRPDKRRGGAWYVGVQAMAGETATFRLDALTQVPLYVPPSRRCDRTTFACALDSARIHSWNSSGPPAPPPSLAALAYIRAEASSARSSAFVESNLEYISSLIANDIIQRMATLFALFVFVFMLCWCYRFYRAKHKYKYRVPHDTEL